MMKDTDQLVLAIAYPDEQEPRQRAIVKIGYRRVCRSDDAVGGLFRVCLGTQIDYWQLDRRGWMDNLDRSAIHDRECRTQNLVTAHHIAQAISQRVDVETAHNPVHRAQDVAQMVPGGLAVFPDALLGK